MNISISASDGRAYNVSKVFVNHKDAVKMMERVNTDVLKLLRSMKQRWGENQDLVIPATEYRRAVVKSILQNYDPDNLAETNPWLTNDTSFTINKGESMTLCFRKKYKPWEFEDYPTILFVVLHEISHIGAFDVNGHPDKFWRVFKFILAEAVIAGIYTPNNYVENPTTYCGMDITYNPLFDDEVKGLN